jgi:Peptidase M50B-like
MSRWDLRRSDAWWLLLYPAYQVIGTARHEGGHALAAWAEGARIERFVVLPSRPNGVLYWGYTVWSGQVDWLVAAAPYLLDLLTVLAFAPLVRYARRWPHAVRMNLIIIGLLSPLVNSAYQYVLLFVRPTNDVGVVASHIPDVFVHAWFAIALPLYVWALVASLRRPAGPATKPLAGPVRREAGRR